MRGTIAIWKDDKGYGFIEPVPTGPRIFFHISEFARGSGRPQVGDVVEFKQGRDSQGRTQAVRVALVVPRVEVRRVSFKSLFLSAMAIVALGTLGWLVSIGRFPAVLFATSLVMSSVAFALYGHDKRAAQQKAWRTPEIKLKLCAVFGGWPGALLAQQVFRHKVSMRSFQFDFWLTVALNCAIVYLLTTPQGSYWAGRFLRFW